MVIKCGECGKEFELSEENAKWYMDTFGSETALPKRCPGCRRVRKQASRRTNAVKNIACILAHAGECDAEVEKSVLEQVRRYYVVRKEAK